MRPPAVDADTSARSGPKLTSGLTGRSVLIGLLMMVPVSYWVVKVEYVQCTLHPTLISLFATSIFALSVLIVLNGIVRRIAPGRQLTQAELITIYVMLNISTCLVSLHCLQTLVSSMPFAAHNADSSNNWGSLFVNKLPSWLVVKDPIALKGYYEGGNLYERANFVPWIVPLICWSIFIFVLFGMLMCINVLFRKQWIEREKLSYPLVQLPLDMTQERAPLLRNKLFWLGFALAGSIEIVNGLSILFPSIPQIPIKNYNYGLFDACPRPWNALGWVPLIFYPFGIGLGMLLPLDMLFSSWFFYWAWKAEFVLSAAFGLDSIPQMPFVGQQSLGAYLGICFFALAMSRTHLVSVCKHFIGRQPDIDDKDEAISYRAAVWFLILGSLFLLVFARLAGMTPWLAVAFFGIFFAISLAITRMRAEMGLPGHDLQGFGPDIMLVSVIGSKSLGTESLSAISMFQWFNRGYQSTPMPFQLESLKMAHETNTRNRSMFVAMCIATVAGTMIGLFTLLNVIYSRGGATSNFAPPICPLHLGSEPWNRMGAWAASPSAPSVDQGLAVLVGFAITLLLNTLRVNIPGFPFHPVGFAVSSSWSMNVLWTSMFIAWLIKTIVLRYGGLKLYRRVLPIFLGLIVGDCIVGCSWTILGAITNLPSYRFFP